MRIDTGGASFYVNEQFFVCRMVLPGGGTSGGTGFFVHKRIGANEIGST